MVSMYDDTNLRTVSDVVGYLNSQAVVDITLAGTSKERADWIRERLSRFSYAKLGKKDKGVILRYLVRITGLTEKQIDRHVRSYRECRNLCESYDRGTFPKKYDRSDGELLAEVDNATGRLAG